VGEIDRIQPIAPVVPQMQAPQKVGDEARRQHHHEQETPKDELELTNEGEQPPALELVKSEEEPEDRLDLAV